MKDSISGRWSDLCARAGEAAERSGRRPGEVRIVAVGKTLPAGILAEAYRAGARIFGENYVQEALPKIESLRASGEMPEAEWHFIGSLQSNKARQVVGRFGLLHSVDRWSLARELDKESKKAGVPVRCLIEVNIAGEGSKSGLPPAELEAFARKISEETELIVEGLMSFPPLAEDPEGSRPYFGRTRELAVELESWKLPRISGAALSMGVTSDFEVAIEEGATLVRVGTAIFGSRS